MKEKLENGEEYVPEKRNWAFKKYAPFKT